MIEKTRYADGVFTWADLSTTDVAGAKAFYGGLFGWTSEDFPTPDGGPLYTNFSLDGKLVAGCAPLMPDLQASGAPPVWVNYVSHSDADEVARRAAEAGGVVFMPPMDIMSQGRMALIQDPTGAPFGVWQPGDHTGAEAMHTVGAIAWNELQTHDAPAAKAFYHRVFGWDGNEVQDGDHGYTQMVLNGEPVAGIMPVGRDWGEVPSHWNIYFWVTDVYASAARAEALGGQLVVPPTSMGEFGEFSLVKDPQGAHFIIARWNEM